MASDEKLPQPEARVVDTESLKALAHPLRVRLLDTLSIYGEATASGLAERLSESSGATSYHLRQLERHGFVREVEGRGTARERWWERVPGSIQFDGAETRKTPAGRAAARLVAREFTMSRETLLREFIERGDDELSPEWRERAGINLTNLHLTAAQFAEAMDDIDALQESFSRRWRGQRLPGSRPVQFQINAFPVMDGETVPEEES